ncbi:MAG: hypothetical protein ACRDRJ_17155 [Streptosporangiaceae bacterium]
MTAGDLSSALPAELREPHVQGRLLERIKAEGRFEAFDEGQAKAFIEARAEGIAKEAAEFLLQLLARRRLAIPAPLRERMLSCVDLKQLGAWLEKAAIASSAEDVFLTKT